MNENLSVFIVSSIQNTQPKPYRLIDLLFCINKPNKRCFTFFVGNDVLLMELIKLKLIELIKQIISCNCECKFDETITKSISFALR